MFWRMRIEAMEKESLEDADGRFVLHRHRDGGGDHLDLRLERDGYLLGWRIDGVEFAGEVWAEEKGPHPLRWLEERAAAAVEDEGVYTWERLGPDGAEVQLQGTKGCLRARLQRETRITAAVARALAEAMRTSGARPEDAARLMADGATARSRAVARLIGLGRELDGETFDAGLWKRQVAGLSLDEIHGHLRSFEARFDGKYPPAPVSQPERLDEDGESGRSDTALAILRG